MFCTLRDAQCIPLAERSQDAVHNKRCIFGSRETVDRCCCRMLQSGVSCSCCYNCCCQQDVQTVSQNKSSQRQTLHRCPFFAVWLLTCVSKLSKASKGKTCIIFHADHSTAELKTLNTQPHVTQSFLCLTLCVSWTRKSTSNHLFFTHASVYWFKRRRKKKEGVRWQQVTKNTAKVK